MSKILLTMAEDVAASSDTTFGIRYPVDEHDCLHFAQSLKDLGHQIYFVNWLDLLDDGFQRMFSFNDSAYVRPEKLDNIDLIFVYKMEGFYANLQRFDWMLDRFAGNRQINDVRTIRHNLSKRYLWQLEEKGVRIIPSYHIREITDRLSAGERFVIKPLRGERGKEIFLASTLKDLDAIADENEFFAQEYMPDIRDGERSLVFFGHEYQHAVIKHPSRRDPNEFRCNESLGGTVAVYEPTDEEVAFCKNVLKTYEQLGYPVHFSRIDVLSTNSHPILLEAEMLNPSIYANYSNKGRATGDRLALYFEQFLHAKERVSNL